MVFTREEVKQKCRTIVGILNNFPDFDNFNQVDEKLNKPVLFKRNPENLHAEVEPIKVPVGHLGLLVEIQFGVIIGEKIDKYDKDEFPNKVDGYVLVLSFTTRESKYESQDKAFALVSEFDSNIAISDIIPADAIPKPDALVIWNRLDGVEIQRATLKDMRHTVAETIEFISKYTLLEPGDIVLCGPAKEPHYAKVGQKLEAGIEDEIRFEVMVGKALEFSTELHDVTADRRFSVEGELVPEPEHIPV
ncbi:unnamed protein product [Bursaphelenchus xylophilus]|uniref:oxaloacetate tautomerase n=1 Tax=Bursaphelenchus xylophilus TaxID=6326 RepID=A0A1I7RT53_BURXY|nr:unnamed protein product [Bursaphelenchus xylophilus]CAG9122604.1 unnamed protein product [Bursaphelenchus xylophilus]